MSATFRLSALLAAGLLLAAPNVASAVDSSGSTLETPPPPKTDSKATAADKKRKPEPKKDKKSEQRYIDGYKAAHAMIYREHDYTGGMAKLRSLGHDDHPDVANLLGYTSRKLGRYDDSRHWYERALAANPNHTLTWSYYGMWHAEQGNLLKARDHLAKLETLCGNTECREYVMLKEVIEGTRVY